MIWQDGVLVEPEASRIDPRDRGFSLGDGLFETLRAHRGRPFALAAHLDRLARGACELGISLPFQPAIIAAGVADVLAANRLRDAAIRVTLSRGLGERGLLPPRRPLPRLLIAASPYLLPPPRAAAVTVTIRRNEGSPLSRLKSLSYLDQVLAQVEAADGGADEALQLNNAGHAAGFARGNLLALAGDRLVTPPVADGALPGITLEHVAALAGVLGLALERRSLPPAALRAARALYLTNSLLEILPIATLDGHAYAEQPETARLRRAYAELRGDG